MAEAALNFFDPEMFESPYEFYRVLRDEHPVFRDPKTGLVHVSRYQDVRTILMDQETFGAFVAANTETPNERQMRVRELYKANGWLPAPTLIGRNGDNHRQMRAMVSDAFRPSRVKKLDGFVQETAESLVSEFARRGGGDWVSDVAVPLPLTIIVQQMGAPREDYTPPDPQWKSRPMVKDIFDRENDQH